MTNLAPGTRVRVRGFTMAFEETSEAARIVKPRKVNLPMPGPDWYLVRFDIDGGVLCAHRDRLMLANDQIAA